MSEFSLDWPYGWQTRRGNVARVLATDLPGDRPVAVYVSDYEKKPIDKTIYRCRSNGRVHDGDDWGSSCAADIINAPAPKPEPRKWWVNLFSLGGTLAMSRYDSRGEADADNEDRAWKRIACVCITEGSGLEGEQ